MAEYLQRLQAVGQLDIAEFFDELKDEIDRAWAEQMRIIEVPRVPTERMIQAGIRAVTAFLYRREVIAIWDAMMAEGQHEVQQLASEAKHPNQCPD